MISSVPNVADLHGTPKPVLPFGVIEGHAEKARHP